ncbi:MAG: citrate lyase, alpha subunit [Firmicutes bacterium]|nr:citrate lyase, alpha subunit [Bacillota bacterium]
MINRVGKEVPDYIEGWGTVNHFAGAFQTQPVNMRRHAALVKSVGPKDSKVINNLKDLFRTIPVKDGMTLGFHHGLRNGDFVINQVVETAAELGIKGLKIATSGIFPIHDGLIRHIKNGVITEFDVNGMIGAVANAVSEGILSKPVVIRTHGGRARAIECGDLKIDVAFIASPTADTYGNINGTEGPSACGSLGYSFPDSDFADYVVAVTDNLLDHPLARISIRQDRVDYVVKVDRIGDPKGINTGIMKITREPLQLIIAEQAARVADALGLIKEGYSFQTGAGGVPLAFTSFVAQMMEQRKLTASFAVGGITSLIVDMLEKGLLRTIFDVQSFDVKAIESMGKNVNHIEMGASFYANPFTSGCIVNRLDNCILGALEIDTGFNVNVITGVDGRIMTGIGGNPDTAAGSKIAMVVGNLLRGRIPVVVDKVHTVCTPGETIDILVTEKGVAVNPGRQDLIDKLKEARIPLKNIHEQRALVEKMVGKMQPPKTTDRVVAIVEYRDGTVIDVIRQVKV